MLGSLIPILVLFAFPLLTLTEVDIQYWPDPLNATSFNGVNCPNAPADDLSALNCGYFCNPGIDSEEGCDICLVGDNSANGCVLACAPEGGMCCGNGAYCAAGTSCISLGYSNTCCTNGVDCPGAPNDSPYFESLTIESPCTALQCSNSTGYKWLCFDGDECGFGTSEVYFGSFCYPTLIESFTWLSTVTEAPVTTLTYCITESTGLVPLTVTGLETPFNTATATTTHGAAGTTGGAISVSGSATAAVGTKSSAVGYLSVGYRRLLAVVIGSSMVLLYF